jgi:hypothetical protein
MTEERMPALNAERVSMGIEELKSRHGSPPWAVPLVANDRFLVMVICQAPGHRNDWHYHLVERSWFQSQSEPAVAGGTHAHLPRASVAPRAVS